MDLTRAEYPAMLASLQPMQAVEVLTERMRHVGKLNSEVADWLQERRRVEELYAAGLRKLAQKRPPDSSSDMGVFTAPWQKFVSAAEALADSHQRFAVQIESDLERPLRSYTGQNRDVQGMSSISGNLTALAKDVDTAQKKAEKLQTKSGKIAADKVAAAASEVEAANSQWESQAPYVFEKLQAVDEQRLNHLKDVLTQFQTHEVDQVARSQKNAEECIAALLTVETADEIKAFAIRAVQGRPRLQQRARSRTLPGSTSAQNEMPPPPVPNRQASQDDIALQQTLSPPPASDAISQRSGSVDQDRGDRSERKRSGFASGLKRMSTTKLKFPLRTPKKEREKSIHEETYTRPEPERKSSSNLQSAFGAFGGRNKSKGNDRGLPAPTEEDEMPRGGQPESSWADSPDRKREGDTSGRNVNGYMQDSNGTSSSAQVDGRQLPMINQDPLQSPESSTLLSGTQPTVDSEGFSIAPGILDAISQAEREAAATQSEPAFRLDIKDAPIQEEGVDSKAVFDNVANTLRAQASTAKRTSTIRGRREVRNTVFVPSPISSDLSPPPTESGPKSAPLSIDSQSQLSSSVGASPMKGLQRQGFSDDPAISDTQSVRSGRSFGSATNNAIRHPDLHGPGLNSSIVEQVSATFVSGQLTKANVLGELALAYNHQDMSAPYGTDSVRLENFDVLEKVAPNPAFIEQIAGRAGSYTVNLSNIQRTAVAFKYQVHQSSVAAVAKHCPIQLSPQWKVESTQTSAILSYGLHPDFVLPQAGSSITLTGVAIVLSLDPSGGKPTNAKSNNGGVFARERCAVYWRLGDVTLTKDAPLPQLRVRFFTESEAKPGPAEARWELDAQPGSGLGSGLGIAVLRQKMTVDEGDPFADDNAGADRANQAEETWTSLPGVMKLKSGNTYSSTA